MMSMNPFLWLILTVIDIYFWIILAMVILSWLVAFNVVNRSNPYVRQIGYALERLTEPLLGPIRRLLPDLGGIDISPIVLLIAMQFFGMLVTWSISGSASRDLAAPAGQGRTAAGRPGHAQASRDEVTGLHTAADGAVSLAVKVTAAPDKGRANKAVIETLARASRLPKSAFTLVSGETDRNKTLLVTGNPAAT